MMKNRFSTLILVLTVLFFTSFFIKVDPLFAQACTESSPCATCCLGQDGLTCEFTECPGGFEPVNPNFSNECLIMDCGAQEFPQCPSLRGISSACTPVEPDPGTTTCPADYPFCTDLTGSLCTNAPGINWSQGCTIALGVVGHCCVWRDLNINCGGHLQACCSASGGVGGNSCDPHPSGLSCETLPIGGSQCCFGPDDPDCSGAGVPLPACPGQCSSTACIGTWRPAPGTYSCPSTQPFCCVPAAAPGPEVFCVANDPEDRTSNPASGNIATAIGCIPVGSTQGFIGFLLRWGVGIAGGIAFILIIYSGFLVITSGGNPQKLQAGKELLTAAITGLVLLIFGAFILEFIGVDILNIPGFGQ